MLKSKKSKFVQFVGAYWTMHDENEKVWEPLNIVYINPDQVAGFYDHTILTGNNKIHVMENLEEIETKLNGGA